MNIFKKLFGSNDPSTKAGRWSWTEHAAWLDLNEPLSDDYAADLKDAAKVITEHRRARGYMSELISIEPSPGNWGRTPDDLHKTFGKNFLLQVQFLDEHAGTDSVFGDFTQGPFAELIDELPAIKRSIQSKAFRFLSGIQRNKCRAVALLVFD